MLAMWEKIAADKFAQISLLGFIALTVWWVYIYLGGTTDAPVNDAFGFVYGGFSLWGGLVGLFTSKRWGGFTSLIGRSIIFLSLGLLLQAFGQYSFWFHNVFLGVDVPYPGIPDLGFFGTIPCYIYAAYLLFKASGAKFALSSFVNKSQAIVIPLLMLGIGYYLFLADYEFDFSKPLNIFLDFGYPLGQAIYISVAILTFSFSRNFLGGMMRLPILTIVVAYIAQFTADYSFVYFQSSFFPASFIDYIYLVAYFLMSLGLIYFKVIADKLKRE